MEFLDPYKTLLEILETQAGGSVPLAIHTGAFLLVVFVVGKLAAKYVFRSESGHFQTLLGSLIPLLLGILIWGGLQLLFNPDLFAVGGFTVDLALLAGVLLGWILGGMVTKAALDSGLFAALVFLILVAAAGAGGVVISYASLTVFQSGEAQMENSQKRLELE